MMIVIMQPAPSLRFLAPSLPLLSPSLLLNLSPSPLVGALCLLQAVAIAVVTVDAFHKYASAVEYTKEGGSRITRTFDAIIAAQDLIFAAKGWRVFRSPEDEAVTRSAIVANMTQFQELHRSMYAIAQGTHVEESYLRRIITTKVFDSSDAGPTGVSSGCTSWPRRSQPVSLSVSVCPASVAASAAP